MTASGAGNSVRNAETGVLSVTGGNGMRAWNGAGAVNQGELSTSGNTQYGIQANTGATAENSGSITTDGSGAFGIFTTSSTVDNSGDLTTNGSNAHGVYSQGSTTTNTGTITTNGGGSYGFRIQSGTATNQGSVITNGSSGIGMYTANGNAVNEGSVTTNGASAAGIYVNIGSADNSGSILTHGNNADGLSLAAGTTGTNSGSMTTSGDNAHAADVNGATFHNSGTLSASGNGACAVNAYNNAQIFMEAGTRVTEGLVAGDASSGLYVTSDTDLSFATTGFGTIIQSGQGTWTISGTSSADSVQVQAGQLAVDSSSVFTVQDYSQTGGTLMIKAVDGSSGLLRATNSADFGNGKILLSPAAGISGQTFALATVDGSNYSNFAGVELTSPHFVLSDYGWNGDTLEATIQYSPQWDNYALTTAVAFDSMANVHEAVRTRIELMTGLLAANEQQTFSDSGRVEGVLVASAGDMFGLLPETKKESPWKPYVQLFGSLADREGVSDAAGYDSRQFGVSLGIDKQFDSVFGGLHFAYAQAYIDFTGINSSDTDSENQELFSLGTYWHWQSGPWVFRDNLTVSHVLHDSKRDDGLGNTATAEYRSWGMGNSLFAGYELRNGDWLFLPEAGLHYYYLHRESFAETGAASPLEYEGLSRHTLEGELDFTAKRRFAHNGFSLTPFARVGWVHALGDNDITLNQQVQGVSTLVYQEEDDDRFKTDLGAVLEQDNCEFTFAYSGVWSEHSRRHGASIKVQVPF